MLSKNLSTTFETIRQQDEAGNEFWSARQLVKVLEYSEYRHFLPVIAKASTASDEDILDMVEIGSGAKREVTDDYKINMDLKRLI